MSYVGKVVLRGSAYGNVYLRQGDDLHLISRVFKDTDGTYVNRSIGFSYPSNNTTIANIGGFDFEGSDVQVVNYLKERLKQLNPD